LNLYNYDGVIYLDNYNIKEINDDILRQNIIYVNQKTNLFDDTIFENIKYGNDNITNDDILKIIQKYNFDYIFKGLNNNYNTNCGVHGNNLSMGMQKITILLRAYFKFNNSKVIIFDEPLASLDHNTRQNVLKLINDIDKNKTIIIITHDIEILSIVNRKININDIKINI
jgi:ABC-type bacteriocin/lantibiotic exporter with double-glycine peptidase domain